MCHLGVKDQDETPLERRWLARATTSTLLEPLSRGCEKGHGESPGSDQHIWCQSRVDEVLAKIVNTLEVNVLTPRLVQPIADESVPEEPEAGEGLEDIPEATHRKPQDEVQLRRQHDATRIPYAAWCSHCVCGRGRDDPHAQKGHEGPPIVELDYTFARSGEQDDSTSTIFGGSVQAVSVWLCNGGATKRHWRCASSSGGSLLEFGDGLSRRTSHTLR